MLRNRSLAAFIGLSLLALFLGLGGCGSDQAVAPPTASESGIGDLDGPVAQVGPTAVCIPPTANPGMVSKIINGDLGGFISRGRVTLIIPPKTFAGRKIITLQIPLSRDVECRILPEYMKLARPVTLQMNLNGLNLDSPAMSIFRLHYTQNFWIDQNALYNSTTRIAQVEVAQFGSFRAGPGAPAFD